MARYRKLRSTEEGRRASYERMVEEMGFLPEMTDEEVVERMGELNYYSYVRPAGQTREQLVVALALALAKRIVTA